MLRWVGRMWTVWWVVLGDAGGVFEPELELG